MTEESPVRTTHTRVERKDDNEDSGMSIPGFTVDKSEPNFAPILTPKSAGVEYYGEWLMNVGMMGPIAVASRYPATHPVTWLLKGIILAPVMLIWLFTLFFPLGFTGLCLALLGESWNKMRGRQ